MANMMEFDVHTYASLSSTQDYVRELAEEGLPEGTVIQALSQTKGRGRHGNAWTSPLGNLYLSVLLRPNCSADRAGQLAFVVALALSAAIEEFIASGYRKTLKWPNDLLIDNQKIAGILLETELKKESLAWLVAGIGVNVMSAPNGAVALKDLSERPVPVHPFRDRVLDHLGRYYARWQVEGFAPIREEWLAQAHGLGDTVRVRLPSETFSGIFADLDEAGALLVSLPEGGQRKITAGDVYF